jgi:lupus La protein
VLKVAFYFGDSNLPQDKFMWTITGGRENKPVDLKAICSFKRMQRFKPYSSVVAALRESDFLVLEGEEGKETIKRKIPYLPQSEAGKNKMARSVYVKGFGDEEPTTQFKIEAWFQKFGTTMSVRLRRTDDNLFKGSVVVEYQALESAQKFLNMDPPPSWEGHDLLIMSKQAYVDGKQQLINEGKLKPSKTNQKGFWEGKVGPNGGGRGRDGNRGNSGAGDHKNGFRDNRNGRGRGRGRGQGRGRGGRGGGRGGRDFRDKESSGDSTSEVRDTKRPRDDAGESNDGQPPAKKAAIEA